MPQVVGLLADLGLLFGELSLALLQLLEAAMRVAHGDPLDVGIGIRVQHVALRVGPKQGLRLVLTVEIDE